MYTLAVHVPRLASGTRPEERQLLARLSRARLDAVPSSPLAPPPSSIQNSHYNLRITNSLLSLSLAPLAPLLLLSHATLLTREPFTRLSRLLRLALLNLRLLPTRPASHLTLACHACSPLAACQTPGKPTSPTTSLWDTMKTTSYISINLSIP